MRENLTVEDLFQIAEQVERRGAQFYRQAADACADEAGHKLLTNLARMEEEHGAVFSATRQDVLRPKGPSRLSPQAEGRFRVVFEALLAGLARDLQGRFLGKTSSASILQEAIGFEKDTIVFLTQLSEMLEDPGDRMKIQAILREELTHVFQLGSQLLGNRPSQGLSAFIGASA